MKHRALVIGAGRIGAGYGGWADLAYTHAGAYKALADRVELVGIVEPDLDRRVKANLKWNVQTFDSIEAGLALEPDVVSVCVLPEQQSSVCHSLGTKSVVPVKGIWCEKPWVSTGYPFSAIVQVNYMRRGDPLHRELAYDWPGRRRLVVYGKDDLTTRCHFDDLAKFWKADLDYRPFSGPCAYILRQEEFDGHSHDIFFDNGGFDTKRRTPGMAFAAMLGNLLDCMEDSSKPLWSPAT